ncbi:Serine carboxypeptidase II-3 [Zea mays]|uniref:Carboxypeptidase n=2 Tax=Zea mays TaxID=4577 RepID=C0P7P2_MAIZE|nr:serine carboxypeptidase 1 precursor [Zea mays]ACN29008.1 unknown [Zea mays]ONM60228.1 Serine carboxypeptidase-like 40 [Zea mays]PWZ15652.1 Serine carboxypeptidase II-3 [Zea mays]
MKPTTSSTLLLAAAVLCLALPLLPGATAKAARARQGDYLARLRGSSPWPAESASLAVAATDRASRHAASPGVGRKEDDRVDRLPGQPSGVDFEQYAGYVTVDAAAGRALFYYLAEAVGGGSASAAKPLLLWLNGGPGCSSLGYGAMEELGPFRVKSDGKTLYRNPYAWNNAANVLFLESPAGVGFSYSNTTADYSRSGDNKTAEDALRFLLNWMEKFPEYKGRDLYLAGESYAGHYVPQLAHAILGHAAAGKPSSSSPLNLRGIMIGNAVINDWTDTKGMYDFFWTHALISDATADAIGRHCNFSAAADADAAASNDKCNEATSEADEALQDIDIYNIYAPNCQSPGLVSPPITPSMDRFDPCSDYYVNAYLNDPDVQRALHANVTRLDHPWSACSDVLRRWTDSATTVLPILTELLNNDIRVWVYSGDTDGRVPVTSSRYSVNQLQLPVAAKWRAWFSSTQGAGEVGGYTVQYKGKEKGSLSLVTVRGAGHEVPSYQPRRALVLVQGFLAGKTLPGCKTCESA